MSRTPDILIVDDEPQVCELIDSFLTDRGLNCQATTSPHRADSLLDAEGPSVLITDVAMPGRTGMDLLGHVRHEHPGCRVILISGVPSTQTLAKALAGGAFDYVSKPFDLERLLQSVRRAMQADAASDLPVRAARAMQVEPHLRQVSIESIRALVHAVEAKDPYTRRHSEHVAAYSVEIARRLGLPEEAVGSIRTAALLHDCGKIGIPDSILTKPGRLVVEEFEQIRRHPVIGYEILSNISAFAGEADIVRAHHERWDGGGYPDGLAGEVIPFGSRVINVADSIDAMLMRRTYKEPFGVHRVLEELQAGRGSQFQPIVADAASEWLIENADRLSQPTCAA